MQGMQKETRLFNSSLDNRVNNEVSLRDFDILLQMKQGQLKFGKLLLRHWYPCHDT
jgi:hypothetical protein